MPQISTDLAIAACGHEGVRWTNFIAQSGAKTIAEKALRHTEVNTETAFATALAIARARTLPEIAHLQANFLQHQVVTAAAQTKELFELSTQITQQAFATINAASVKAFEQLTKNA